MNTLDRICEFWPQTPTTGPSPREIPNVGREDLARLFHYLHFKAGAEIGTERGYFAETICRNNPDVQLYCIDPYRAYKGYREHKSQRKLDGFYAEAQKRLSEYQYRVDFVRRLSIEAASSLYDESLDFIYIDGNHSLLHVVQDLCYWVPKVRSGGIVAGHDYIRRAHTGYALHVVQAVYAYADSYGIDPYYVLGTKAVVEGEVRDKPRSFMWVKGMSDNHR